MSDELNEVTTEDLNKKLNDFWLTFEDSIYETITDEEKKEIKNLSKKLSKMEKDEKIDSINAYIKNNIEKLGYRMIKNRNFYKSGHLEENIERWKKITGHEMFVDNNTFYVIFSIFCHAHKKYLRKNKDKMNELIGPIIEFAKDPSDIKQLIILMNASIKYEISSNIDKLSNILDVKAFIDDSHELTDSFIEMTRWSKLVKYMKPININE